MPSKAIAKKQSKVVLSHTSAPHYLGPFVVVSGPQLFDESGPEDCLKVAAPPCIRSLEVESIQVGTHLCLYSLFQLKQIDAVYYQTFILYTWSIFSHMLGTEQQFFQYGPFTIFLLLVLLD